MSQKSSKNAPIEINRRPLTVQAASVIRSSIMDGEFAPGEKLQEQALAERYKISRHVVREALHLLEGEGLVVNDAFCGRSVFKPTPQQIEGAYLLRISLEVTAAALAAYKVTPQQGQELREKATLPSDIRFSTLVEWDETIHRAIWTIADELFLTSHLEKVVWTAMKVGPAEELAQEDQLRMVQHQLESERSGHPSGHGPLVNAICGQSPAAARDAMLVHFLTPAIGTLLLSKEIMDVLSAAFARDEPIFGQQDDRPIPEYLRQQDRFHT